MKGSALVLSLIVVCVIAVIGMVAFIFLHGSSSPAPITTNNGNSAAAAVSIAPVKDFAPGVPMSQKTTILIQTSDSSDVKYIVPKDQVATYVKSLPEGYHVVSTSQ